MGSNARLVVESINMYENDNAAAHHTSAFEVVHLDPPTPVLRRGQAFKLAIGFNRAYADGTDIVKLIFGFGKSPNAFRGTQGVITITNRDTFASNLQIWSSRFISVEGNEISLEVRSPSGIAVGVWTLNVETTTLGSTNPPNTYKYERDSYLLFNPWINEDMVYMEDKQLLDEYVLNDAGKIWVGSYRSSRGREWMFGQFDASVLRACMLALERSGIQDAERGNPIKVSRALSKIINANDDNGVMWGNWTGNYEGGTRPSAWTGSVPILKKYLETGNPVNFGQCWVFSGVTTTICRALGLPSRAITNFVSAHDANSTLSIDEFYDENNNRLNYDPTNSSGRDGLWNFHVWNEAWMARPDLPTIYGGWQAIDSTPQEVSDGFNQCGPASVKAIREGVVGYNYDIGFMVSTVNADLIRWKKDPSTDFGYSMINTDQKHIGRAIITKAPGSFDHNGDTDREDITSTYKDPEGSLGERSSLLKAIRGTHGATRYHSLASADAGDVEFDFVDIDRINIGQPFAITVNMKNKSTEPRNIMVLISAESVYYTGVKASLVKKHSGTFEVLPNFSHQMTLTITADDYLDKLVEYGMIKLHAIAIVPVTKQIWTDEDDFQILKPTINIKIEREGVVARSFKITLSFMNPLKITLTDCTFNCAGPGELKNTTHPIGDVGPEAEVRVEYQLIARMPGPQKVIATFTSKQLMDITGSTIGDFSDNSISILYTL